MRRRRKRGRRPSVMWKADGGRWRVSAVESLEAAMKYREEKRPCSSFLHNPIATDINWTTTELRESCLRDNKSFKRSIERIVGHDQAECRWIRGSDGKRVDERDESEVHRIKRLAFNRRTIELSERHLRNLVPTKESQGRAHYTAEGREIEFFAMAWLFEAQLARRERTLEILSFRRGISGPYEAEKATWPRTVS
ncbi:unnamed protein product [Heterotrigona itama]|uniref:Uncharacterized protein n=1 Tax=Heterotrigona itama TaxID=395501 RepID=A0A6V7HAL0_9HYME|nr:unnamed protein product [Heterotrigona itama]